MNPKTGIGRNPRRRRTTHVHCQGESACPGGETRLGEHWKGRIWPPLADFAVPGRNGGDVLDRSEGPCMARIGDLAGRPAVPELWLRPRFGEGIQEIADDPHLPRLQEAFLGEVGLGDEELEGLPRQMGDRNLHDLDRNPRCVCAAPSA